MCAPALTREPCPIIISLLCDPTRSDRSRPKISEDSYTQKNRESPNSSSSSFNNLKPPLFLQILLQCTYTNFIFIDYCIESEISTEIRSSRRIHRLWILCHRCRHLSCCRSAATTTTTAGGRRPCRIRAASRLADSECPVIFAEGNWT